MSDKKSKILSEKAVGFDSLLDDVFGLNIKGLKSIWTLFRRPVDYFRKAKLPEWDNEYTPSFRIWFGLMAITTGLRFLWGSEASPMYQLYLEQMTLVGEQLGKTVGGKSGELIDVSNYDPALATDTLLKWMFAITPFIVMGLVAILAVIYRAWGERLSYVVRLRYLFAIVLTGNFISLISLPLIFVPNDFGLPIFTSVGMIAMICLYILTAYRGPYRDHDAGARLGLSVTIGLIMFLLNSISIFVAIIFAMVPALEAGLG